MKKTIFLFALSLMTLFANAQFTILGKGPTFEEPETGFAKVLIMKNGNTAYIHVTIKDGILLKIYGADRKQILSKEIEHKFGKLKGLNVEGCLETEGNITLLLSEYDERTPMLDRIVLDATTGKIISQETIATLKKMTMGQGYAILYGGVPMPDFIVRRDPNSENYIVATFNTFASERDRRVEVIHYNSKNEVVSKSYLSTPDDKYKFVNILDVAVMEDKEAYALIYAYNTKKSGGKEEDLILAKFTKNAENVEYKILDLEDGYKVSDGIIKHNKVTNKLHVLTQVLVSTKTKRPLFAGSYTNSLYALTHYIYDSKTNNVNTLGEINLSSIDNKYKELFGKKEDFSAVLQNFYINDDGGFSIILEGVKTVVSERGSYNSSTGYSSSRTSYQYYLTDIGVINYNVAGNITTTALVPKSQYLTPTMMSGIDLSKIATPLYHYKRDFTAQQLHSGNQYKSFAYLNGKTKNYILLNDIQDNEEKIQKGKLTTIKSVSDCDGFSFETNTSTILPSRKMIFKKGDKKDNNLGIFTISDYNREANIYATLKLEVDGRDKKVRIVWMTPE